MLGLFGDFNDANLLFLGGLPRWVLWLLIAVGVAVLVFSWFDLRDLKGRRRFVAMTLRTSVLVLGLSLLIEPALELRHVTRIKNHVVFLVDDSLSMSLPHDDQTTRWQGAQNFLIYGSELFSQPDEEHLFEVLRFGDEVVPSTFEDVASTERPDAEGTQILEALQSISEMYPRRELGGIVVVSDGSDAGLLSGRVRPGEPLDTETRRFIESLGAPVHALTVGDPDNVRDLAIERVLVDDFAFVRNRVTVEVIVRAIGLETQLLPVTLRREGEVLQIRELTLSPEEPDQRITFEFIPEQIGKEIYTISVPVLGQELLPENNEAHFILKVIRDKIRVLQVSGRPSWDERFLREQLKRNPNVDLISFFILRTDMSLQTVPNSELSLIPFPTQELFEEQLGSFDLVIFQNFTYRPYGMYRYLSHIEDYVNAGGAFMMVGGEQSFSSGGYAGTPISRLLPVQLPGEGPDEFLIDATPFEPVLTSAGANHPITQLEFAPSENRYRWQDLPDLQGTNIVSQARPEATVLLEHPSLMASGDPQPVLSVMQVGDGRTMALTADSSWRWSFSSVGDGGTSRGYTTFWNSAIRWLIRDPELRLMQVETPQEHVAPGDPFPVTIRVFQPDYSPAAGVNGQWELQWRPLYHLSDPGAVTVIDSSAFTTDERGRVDLELTVEEPGAYTVRASATLESTGEIADEDLFLALVESRELRDILPRPDLLEALAEASGGEVADDLEASDLEFAEAQTVQVNRRRIIGVWNTPYTLGFLALLLGLEWALRRRWGRL